MFTAPHDINNFLVHSKLKLSEQKSSEILNYFCPLQQPVRCGTFLKPSSLKADGARFRRKIPCSKKVAYKQSEDYVRRSA